MQPPNRPRKCAPILPCGGSAHAEAADEIRFSSIGYWALNGIESFEEIDLSGELVRIAIATV